MTDSVYALFCTLGNRRYEASKDQYFPGCMGDGLHDGFVLQCPGTAGTDGDGTPIVTDRHVVGILAKDLANPQPDVVYRIRNQPQFDTRGNVIGDSDSGWINSAVFHFVDSTGVPTGQDAIDPANPMCVVCGKPINI